MYIIEGLIYDKLYLLFIGRHVTQMRKQYEGMFTIDRLYVLMASEVNEKCGHSKLAIRFICLLMGKRNLI